MEVLVIPSMERVAVPQAIWVKNVQNIARKENTVKIVSNNVNVKMAAHVISKPVNVHVRRVGQDHCEYF